MRTMFYLSALGLALAIGPAATAQQAAPGAAPMPGADAAPMMAAMNRMMAAMAAAPMTGDADRDFVAMMIPHHQGAIDMARYELAHGHDPAMRKLAQDVVAAQESEIATMTAWRNGHAATP